MDLITERIDVAFRGGPLRDSDYVARRFLTAPVSLFASPDYIARHGTPVTLLDLAKHDCLISPRPPGRSIWRLQGPKGNEEEIEVTGRFAANTVQALRLAAVAGLGIAMLPGMMAAPDTAAGRLTPVLQQYKRHDQGMNVVYPSRRQVSLAVKAFVNSVLEKFDIELASP